MSKFREILNLQLLHEYYLDGRCNDFHIVPDHKTKQWISSRGAKFLQTENIGRLFIPDSLDLEEESNQTPEAKLQFNGVSSNIQFINFTDFPIDKIGHLVFSNHEASFLPNFEEAEDAHGNSNIAVFEFLLAKLVKEKPNWPVNYSAQFNSRRTKWKYYFINNSLPEKTELKLGGKGYEMFSGPGDSKLPNGDPAQLFDSGSNLIPIKQKSDIDLNVMSVENENINSSDRILIEHLPNASPESLQSDIVENQSEIYSAMYVYL